MQIVTKPIFCEGTLFCTSSESLRYSILTIVKHCVLLLLLLLLKNPKTKTQHFRINQLCKSCYFSPQFTINICIKSSLKNCLLFNISIYFGQSRAKCCAFCHRNSNTLFQYFTAVQASCHLIILVQKVKREICNRNRLNTRPYYSQNESMKASSKGHSSSQAMQIQRPFHLKKSNS